MGQCCGLLRFTDISLASVRKTGQKKQEVMTVSSLLQTKQEETQQQFLLR